MHTGIVKWLVVAAFALHGLGMAGAAVYLPWSMRSPSADLVGASWLLGKGVWAIAVAVTVWMAAGSGFIAAAVGFFQDAAWWRSCAWLGSFFTLAAIGLWAGNVPAGVYVGGALAVGTIGYLVLR